MKNKKGLSPIIVIIISVVFTFLAVGLVYAVIMNILGEPHFKITKEGDCKIEIGEYEGYISTRNLLDYFEGNNEFNTPYPNRIYIWNEDKNHLDSYFSNKSCEQVEVEVDEIEIYDRLIYYNINDYIPATMFANESYTLFTNHEDYWFYENYEKISKKDIKIEWLDENCEITKFTKCEDLECKNQEIYEYKCEFDETYYVETWGR